MKRWKSFSLANKILILTGAAVPILISLCAGGFALIPHLPNLLYQVKKSFAPPTRISNVTLSEPGIITSRYGDKEYYLVSSDCWEFKGGEDNKKLSGAQSATAELYFVVSTTRNVMLENPTIYLDSYASPPDFFQLSDYEIKLGNYGGGNFDSIDLGNIDVFPARGEFHPSSHQSIRIPEMDGLAFTILINFSQPGEYVFHFEVDTRDFLGKEQKLISESIKLNWVHSDNFGNILFYDPVNSRQIQLEKCK